MAPGLIAGKKAINFIKTTFIDLILINYDGKRHRVVVVISENSFKCQTA